MTHGQFITPTSPEVPHDAPLESFVAPEQLLPADTPYSIETEEGPYRLHVQLAHDIIALRESADEKDLPMTAVERALDALRRYVKDAEPVADRFTNLESYIGGGLFAAHSDADFHHRFWLDATERPVWYYAEFDTKTQRPVSVIGYEVSTTDIRKFIGARTLPFEEGEGDRLLMVIEAYHAAVWRELYSRRDDYALTA